MTENILSHQQRSQSVDGFSRHLVVNEKNDRQWMHFLQLLQWNTNATPSTAHSCRWRQQNTLVFQDYQTQWQRSHGWSFACLLPSVSQRQPPNADSISVPSRGTFSTTLIMKRHGLKCRHEAECGVCNAKTPLQPGQVVYIGFPPARKPWDCWTGCLITKEAT